MLRPPGRATRSHRSRITVGSMLKYCAIPPAMPAILRSVVERTRLRLAMTRDATQTGRNKWGPRGVYSSEMATTEEIKEQVIAALKTVNDPELGIDIYHLGLVYDILINEENNDV